MWHAGVACMRCLPCCSVTDRARARLPHRPRWLPQAGAAQAGPYLLEQLLGWRQGLVDELGRRKDAVAQRQMVRLPPLLPPAPACLLPRRSTGLLPQRLAGSLQAAPLLSAQLAPVGSHTHTARVPALPPSAACFCCLLG